MVNQEVSRLLEAAQAGDGEGLNALLGIVRPRVFAYLYRSSLDKHISEDLVQETLMQVTKSIGDIRNGESFWPWVFRIASNKLNQFYRQRKNNTTSLDKDLMENIAGKDDQLPESRLTRRELAEKVIAAVSGLKESQRQVVALRCYEEMSFSQIGAALSCSETDARVLFHRAKQSVLKNLKKGGFKKASLLSALVLFGQATSESKAAAQSVYVASEVVYTGNFLATAWTFLSGIAGKAAVVVVMLAAGLGIYEYKCSQGPKREKIMTVHYVAQEVMFKSGITEMFVQTLMRGSASSFDGGGPDIFVTKGAYENWLYFPEGPDGPVLRKMQRWDIEKKNKLCSWLQDGSANRYNFANQTIYLTNDPLALLYLPTDEPEFTVFLERICGGHRWQSFERYKTGVLKGGVDTRVFGTNFSTNYEYNSFDFATLDWNKKLPVKDECDEMHKRGWTYVKISGNVGGKAVSGLARLPFTYYKSKNYSPWLRLKCGNVEAIDVNSGAYLKLADGHIKRYPRLSFFKGLGRPWFGIRAFDTLRRDAAQIRMLFTYSQKSEISTIQTCEGDILLEYYVDMNRDLILKILCISPDGSTVGQINFEYAGPEQGGDISEPAVPAAEVEQSENANGMAWLIDLLSGRV